MSSVAALCLIAGPAAATELGEEHVLILVNGSSPVSAYVAKIYREYHPGIEDNQVLVLEGLTDCASPTATSASEILFRNDYETRIAQPVREHLLAHDLVDQIHVILTTSGMPYRIEDTDQVLKGDVIIPHGSNVDQVRTREPSVNAATVESELPLLWQFDPSTALPSGARAPDECRLVNPYSGYINSITRWAYWRDILGRRAGFEWALLWNISFVWLEGEDDGSGCSAPNRTMCPGDVYLVARLDAPRNEGENPIFSVRQLLERAARVSDSNHVRFQGYNPELSAVVIDDSPGQSNLDNSYLPNFPKQWNFGEGTEPLHELHKDDFPVPPSSTCPTLSTRDDNREVVRKLTGETPVAGVINTWTSSFGLGARVYFDARTGLAMNQSHLAEGDRVIALTTFGKNADHWQSKFYLLAGGPGGGPMYKVAPGAVFTSLESFNAVTMFSNPNTNQAKIVDWIAIGGSGAVGHGFEPLWRALVDTEFLFTNLLRDDDMDGIGDLTFVEAASTGLPYLSWAEVILGDPLMRLRLGPGGTVELNEAGDVNGDGIVNGDDAPIMWASWGAEFGDGNYDDRADLDRDGVVGFDDLDVIVANYGRDYNTGTFAGGCFNGPWPPGVTVYDLNFDGTVNLEDFDSFANCFSGPNAAAPPVTCYGLRTFCQADLDNDGDVDLADYNAFQVGYGILRPLDGAPSLEAMLATDIIGPRP